MIVSAYFLFRNELKFVLKTKILPFYSLSKALEEENWSFVDEEGRGES